MNRNIALLIGILLSLDVIAHQDKIIQLTKDGELKGLPDSYSPAFFDSVKWSLKIAGNHFVFPSCVSDILNTQSHDGISITSSWYHTRAPRMPNYLHIKVISKRFSVVVGLDDATPFELDADTLKYQDSSKVKYRKLTESDICGLLK